MLISIKLMIALLRRKSLKIILVIFIIIVTFIFILIIFNFPLKSSCDIQTLFPWGRKLKLPDQLKLFGKLG